MKNKLKWIITLIVGLCLIAAVIGIAVKLDRSTTDERLGSEAYSIGIIDVEGDVDKTDKSSIYTRNSLDLDGLSIELAEDTEVTYSLYFYDAKDRFLSVGTELSAAPEGAECVRIVITPVDDDEVSLWEVSGYANQLIVRIAK